MALYERGYILDTVTYDVIEFNYYEPPQRTGGEAEWVETPIRMRSEPHQTWVNTSAVTYALTGKIVASVEQSEERSGRHVEKDVNFLESLSYPDYVGGNGGVVRPPHKARIWLRGNFDGIGLIKGLSVTNMDITDEDHKPLVVEVSFNFTVINEFPPSYTDVRKGRIRT